MDLKHLHTTLLAGALTLCMAHAQETRVYYPDRAIEAPRLLFPFYTLGSGGTVRYQTQCPDTFAGLPTNPMICTKVGFQLAGQAPYARFEIRFGQTTQNGGISTLWNVNLPDQRIQADESGTVLQGGGTPANPANRWVEYELAHPFVYRPGNTLTLDITASAGSANSWCQTAVSSHERLYDAPYRNGPDGLTVSPTSGLKMVMVFEPVTSFPTFGTGCAGTAGFVPAHALTGSSQVGNTVTAQLSNALHSTSTVLLVGLSRQTASFGDLPVSLIGCDLLVSAEATVFTNSGGTAPGLGVAASPLDIPNNPNLVGALLFTQWLQLDRGSISPLGFTTSNAATLIVR